MCKDTTESTKALAGKRDGTNMKAFSKDITSGAELREQVDGPKTINFRILFFPED